MWDVEWIKLLTQCFSLTFFLSSQSVGVPLWLRLLGLGRWFWWSRPTVWCVKDLRPCSAVLFWSEHWAWFCRGCVREAVSTGETLSAPSAAWKHCKVNVRCSRNGKGDVWRAVELLFIESGCKKSHSYRLHADVVFGECWMLTTWFCGFGACWEILCISGKTFQQFQHCHSYFFFHSHKSISLARNGIIGSFFLLSATNSQGQRVKNHYAAEKSSSLGRWRV